MRKYLVFGVLALGLTACSKESASPIAASSAPSAAVASGRFHPQNIVWGTSILDNGDGTALLTVTCTGCNSQHVVSGQKTILTSPNDPGASFFSQVGSDVNGSTAVQASAIFSDGENARSSKTASYNASGDNIVWGTSVFGQFQSGADNIVWGT